MLFFITFLFSFPHSHSSIWIPNNLEIFFCVCNTIDEVHLSEFREAGEDTLAL